MEAPAWSFGATQGVSRELELDSSTLSSAPSHHSPKGPGSRLKLGTRLLERGQQTHNLCEEPMHPCACLVITLLTYQDQL